MILFGFQGKEPISQWPRIPPVRAKPAHIKPGRDYGSRVFRVLYRQIIDLERNQRIPTMSKGRP